MASWTTVGRAARHIAPLLLAAWLGACAAGGDPQAAFDLAPAAPRPQRTVHAQVYVLYLLPRAISKADRIFVRLGRRRPRRPAPTALPLPGLIESRFSDSLQKPTTPARSVGRSTNLETDVRALQLYADQEQVVVELVVKLVTARHNLVVAVKTFKAQAPTASADRGPAMAALNARSSA